MAEMKKTKKRELRTERVSARITPKFAKKVERLSALRRWTLSDCVGEALTLLVEGSSSLRGLL